jgi:hypothetical protein
MFMQKLVPNVLHDFLKIFEIMGLWLPLYLPFYLTITEIVQIDHHSQTIKNWWQNVTTPP